jgi:poly(ADP-ribose) glycohydrolase ARH3
MAPTKDQYMGCLLGLAMGDTLGAPYEGGPAERALWRVIGRTRDGLRRWTDDTQMALDLAESLLSVGALDQGDLANRFARSYQWSRGYGPSTARMLKRIRRGEPWTSAAKAVHRAGSFGNGAAMRASVLALFFTESVEALVSEARKAAEVTHCHPLGVEGAVLISVAAHKLLNMNTELETLSAGAACCSLVEFQERLRLAEGWMVSDAAPTPREVAKRLGNGMSAHSSCVSALYIALRYLHADFSELMDFVIACKGDVDTIGAMAGTLWGAYNGASALPRMRLEQHAAIESTAIRLHAREHNAPPDSA